MTVDYLPIANGGGANVETQAQYVTDLNPGGSLQDGYQAGTALSAQVNKTLRQSSMISAAVANVISNVLGIDVLDDGNLANLIANLQAAITASSFTTGDMKPTIKTVADAGWVLFNDGTIGSAASGADYANNNAQALFELLWNNTAQGDCPVIGGRGGSAAADWAANKKIALPKILGRALGGAGAGAGLTARNLGSTVGEESVVLAAGQLPDHKHLASNFTPPYSYGGFGLGGGGIDAKVLANLPGQPAFNNDTGSVDGAVGGAHDNMQPTTFVNWMIKL